MQTFYFESRFNICIGGSLCDGTWTRLTAELLLNLLTTLDRVTFGSWHVDASLTVADAAQKLQIKLKIQRAAGCQNQHSSSFI